MGNSLGSFLVALGGHEHLGCRRLGSCTRMDTTHSNRSEAMCHSCHGTFSDLKFIPPGYAEAELAPYLPTPLPCLQDGVCGGAGLQRPEQQPGQWRQQWRHGEVRAWGRPPRRLPPRAVHPPPQRTHQPLFMVSLRGGAPAFQCPVLRGFLQAANQQCPPALCGEHHRALHCPMCVACSMEVHAGLLQCPVRAVLVQRL